jgi:serine/threonine protein phosphatase 1
MKYFVISDVHGYYSVLRETLLKNGFNESNNNHHLVILGDLFDRGPQSKEVLEYVYELSQNDKATIILGNHDSFLLEFIEKNYARTLFNIQHNGFGETLRSLSLLDPSPDNLDTIRDVIIKRYPFLYEWINSFPWFLEKGKYIFGHGGVDGNTDWKRLKRKDYIWSREITLEPIDGKTVVAGHHRVATIRYPNSNYFELYRNNPSAFDILYEPGKILIDRFVEISQELNVLIIDL